MPFPRITFGIILLNGQPFVRYNLRALYPFAHQIIVVEGAVAAAAEIANDEGHSIDGSLDELYRFQEEEDPENKLEIVTREGLWSEKDEMSQAYAQRATGDYLWQVDIDEFYQPQDMQQVLMMLRDDPQITAVSFKQTTFWGGFDYIAKGWYLQQGGEIFHRLFQWQTGYSYTSHRPPTVLDNLGQNLRDLGYVSGYDLARSNIILYHYSLLFPRQVVEKSFYYSQADWAVRKEMQPWADEAFGDLKRPFRVHNVYHYPSWLERYRGQHPPQIQALREDIASGSVDISLRPTDDIEALLQSPKFRIGRRFYQFLGPLAQRVILLRRKMLKKAAS
jgi:hypothetical protein